MPGTGDERYFRGVQGELRANQMDSLAQEGARRLSQYGPQGQQWAEALLRDPRATLTMANEYGGMGAIEKGLAGAIAAGQSTERRGNLGSQEGLTGMELEAYARGDLESLKKLREARKIGGETANDARRSQAIWGGGGGDATGGISGGGAPMGLESLKLNLAKESEDPAKIQEVQDRARYSSGWKHSDLISQKAGFEKRLLPFDNLESQLVAMRGLNPEVPLDILQMVNMFQRNIDEGIVRGEDVKLQQFATMSGWESFKAKLVSLYDSNEAIPTDMGRKLKSALRRQLRDKSNELNMIVEDVEDYADRNEWGEAERAVAIPRQLQAERNLDRLGRSGESLSGEAREGPDGVPRKQGSDGLWYAPNEPLPDGVY